ncbi:MAG: hypothetical protein SRB2_02413 [Desulfobacteraceae bacterium Eth-SRB2]|nr:MAG: hypothetical protein SRB2_02413 [Desulfobacteraceae bacterium Eth-SRB2]
MTPARKKICHQWGMVSPLEMNTGDSESRVNTSVPTQGSKIFLYISLMNLSVRALLCYMRMMTQPLSVSILFFGEDLNPIFANMANFYTGVQVHLINSDEWIDKFVSYDRLGGVQYFSESDPELDRRITPNALVPPPENSNPPKGVRLIECLDLYEYSPLGLALKKAPPDGLEKNDGNAVIYTQRIWRYYRNSFDAGHPRDLQYYTFENGDWTLKESFDSPPESQDLNPYLEHTGVNLIIKELFAFYTAHEGLGHPLDLTPTVEGTKKESYGYHHADGTGTIMDIKIVQVIDRKDTAFNKFYIPVSFGISDKREMRFLSSQELIPF